MKKQHAAHFEIPSALRHDAHTLFEDAQSLLEATSEITDQKVSEARKRLAKALENGQGVYQDLRERVIASAKAADEAVHEHPYRMVGLGFGLGVLMGVLLKRRG